MAVKGSPAAKKVLTKKAAMKVPAKKAAMKKMPAKKAAMKKMPAKKHAMNSLKMSTSPWNRMTEKRTEALFLSCYGGKRSASSSPMPASF